MMMIRLERFLIILFGISIQENASLRLAGRHYTPDKRGRVGPDLHRRNDCAKICAGIMQVEWSSIFRS
jgi:hypothetical protein